MYNLYSGQFAIYRRLRIGRDDHLDQSEAYDISQLAREKGSFISISQAFKACDC